MNKSESNSYWQVSRAASVRKIDKLVLFILFIAGVAAVANFLVWWVKVEHVDVLALFAIFSFIFIYVLARLVFVWYTYLNVSRPDVPVAPKGLTVAVFTTSYRGEPLDMVRKTLEACKNISYPHTTYLLDNTEDPAFRTAAEEFGAVWLELINVPGAKAGKINRALELTTEDYILVLDPDHIPFPKFLDNTLGFFSDAQVGFVQVSQAYYNQNRSFMAHAAAQQTYTFYGATQMGYNGLGCAIAIGANCTFRRAAFDSIGGHVVGLAEDLQTSLKLHAAGWKSVYNPVVVSRGIVPEDFNSFAKQQFKWAFGALGFIYNDLPAAFPNLSMNQKITYLSIATYYFSGFINLLFLLLPFLFFVTGYLPVNMLLGEFVLNGMWIVLVSIAFYIYVQRWMCHPASERGWHWRAMILKFAVWPVFLYGMLLSLAKVDVPYIPTAKRADASISPFAKPFLWYSWLFVFVFALILLYRMFFIELGDLLFSSVKTWIMMGFAFMSFAMSLWALFVVRPGKHLYTTDPWDELPTGLFKKSA
ncbi:MAG: glycosyltransferase [Bacteroidales bacterium]|nr:glycosyltransferase [Bacteroidales bacterium]